MRAITVRPGQEGSLRVAEVPEPPPEAGAVLVQGIALGVCGTDREIAAGEYGWAPEGREELVLGHESLGRVLEAPPHAGLAEGDLVVGIVRRPDPVPCACCAQGEWDMCRNGQYTERGIKALDGYGAELVTLEADFAIPVPAELGTLGVLTEPASILAKAWEQIDRIGTRACSEHERALVIGAGPIGLLAALMGAQRGLEVHVLDRNEEGPKPELVGRLGAQYHTSSVETVARESPPDIIVEATGVPELVLDVMEYNAAVGIVCLTGVSPRGRHLTVDAGGLNRDLVLENDVVFGSVNANQGHFKLAADALARADRSWLEGLISRRVPLEDFQTAVEKRPDDVKVVLDL
jgi:threonine dehydrogenase-like Zn-dependent dehydrogenase